MVWAQRTKDCWILYCVPCSKILLSCFLFFFRFLCFCWKPEHLQKICRTQRCIRELSHGTKSPGSRHPIRSVQVSMLLTFFSSDPSASDLSFEIFPFTFNDLAWFYLVHQPRLFLLILYHPALLSKTPLATFSFITFNFFKIRHDKSPSDF